MNATSRKPRKFWFLMLGAFAVALAFAIGTRQKLDKSQIEEPADRIVVEKGHHTLTLLRGGKVLKVYRVALGRGGAGPKLKAGDNKVPEGTYRIIGRNAHSAFHRGLRVGYPTPEEVAQARSSGVDPGGDIMVHGLRNGLGWVGSLQSQVDWTSGCIAVTDGEIEEIWRVVPDGTTIEIRP